MFRKKKRAAYTFDKVEDELPVEIWVEIFSYLEPVDEVNLELTCTLFYDIVMSYKDEKLDLFIAERKKQQKKAWKRQRRAKREEEARHARERREDRKHAYSKLCKGCWCCGKVCLQWLSPYIFCPCFVLIAPFMCCEQICKHGICRGNDEVADAMWTMCASAYCVFCIEEKNSDDMCPCVPWCKKKAIEYGN